MVPAVLEAAALNKSECLLVSEAHLCLSQEIAEIKMPDLNSKDIEAAMRVVEGTARNMGITVDA